MGRAKQLLSFAGSTVLDRIMDKVLEAGFAPVFLVVGGPHEETLRKAFSGRGISIVTNPAPEPGGTITSIRCGLKALESSLESRVETSEQSSKQDLGLYQVPALGFLLHPSDFPAVSAKTYDLLFNAIHAAPGSIIVPTCLVAAGQGKDLRDNENIEGIGWQRTHRSGWRRGHPVWFPSSLLHAFMKPLPGGARDLLRAHSDLVRELPVEDPGVHLNVDTPANYAQLSSFAS